MVVGLSAEPTGIGIARLIASHSNGEVSTLIYSHFRELLQFTCKSQPINVLTISNLSSKKDDISSADLPLL